MHVNGDVAVMLHHHLPGGKYSIRENAKGLYLCYGIPAQIFNTKQEITIWLISLPLNYFFSLKTIMTEFKDREPVILVKKAGIQDIEQLQEISKQTFIETFAEANTAENLAKYLHEELSIRKLSTELEDADARFYFAVDGLKVIGYLKLNTGKSQTELRDDRSMEIERIYVLKAYHGKDIGRLLLEKALHIALDLEVEYVWLGVWEKNPRAIKFYLKNKFVEFDKHIFRLGDDLQTDIMMKLELRKKA